MSNYIPLFVGRGPSRFRLLLSPVVLGTGFLCACLCLRARDTFSEKDRQQVLEILHTTENDLRTQYYDSSFHGVDLHVRFQQAESRINASKSYLEAIGSVEWAIAGLNDSHTYLIPPSQPFEIDYGFRFQFYGDSCYVTQVKKEGDAEKQGLKVGDQLLALDHARLIRSQYSVLERSLNLLAPRTKVQLAFLSPGDKTIKTITVETKVNRTLLGDLNSVIRRIEDRREKSKPATAEIGDVLVWRQPIFYPYHDYPMPMSAPPPYAPPLGEKAESFIKHARKKQALVLDLRGNSGGLLSAESWLIGAMFDHDVHIYDRIDRTGTTPETAKSIGKNAFLGKLVIIVDSTTGSAAEIFARVMQLERRGYVIGDQTSGNVRQARLFPHDVFNVPGSPKYLTFVSTADMIMTDGGSLEGKGVTPDEKLLPTAEDLAAGRDPLLAAGVTLAGFPMTPEQASNLLFK